MAQDVDIGTPTNRTLDVLEALTAAESQLSFTDLCRMTDTPKASMNRMLGNLQARGYVAMDRVTGAYVAGIKCFELGALWAQSLDIRAVAAPHLERLNELTYETVHLGVYDAGDVVYVEKIESSHQVVAKSHVGKRCPATAVATGRVLLASQDRREIDRALSESLEKYTPQTLNDPQELDALLEDIRQLGYAVNRCNYREGVSGIAGPIRDHTGAVVAAVGLCLPDYRFTDERFAELRDFTLDAAADISRALGVPAGMARPRTTHEAN